MASNVIHKQEAVKQTHFKKSRKWAATPVYEMQIATYGVKTEESHSRAAAWLPGMSFVKSKDT